MNMRIFLQFSLLILSSYSLGADPPTASTLEKIEQATEAFKNELEERQKRYLEVDSQSPESAKKSLTELQKWQKESIQHIQETS